jgi:hypothetical protein
MVDADIPGTVTPAPGPSQASPPSEAAKDGFRE